MAVLLNVIEPVQRQIALMVQLCRCARIGYSIKTFQSSKKRVSRCFPLVHNFWFRKPQTRKMNYDFSLFAHEGNLDLRVIDKIFARILSNNHKK